MAWNDWVYTIPAAGTNATAGKVIASVDWNAIFTDLQTALNQLAGVYINTTGVNFNAGNTDTSVTIALPTGFTKFLVDAVKISGASQTLSTATVSLWTAAGGTGTQIMTSTAVTVTTAALTTLNNAQNIIPGVANTLAIGSSITALFFRVLTAQGAPATGNVTLRIIPLP